MIRFLDLQKVTACHAEEYHEAARQVIDSGRYLLGEQVEAFESAYASFIGTRHCIGVGNGLDALTLIFRAYKEMGLLHEGDEVLVPANTFIASVLSITENGLRPVFVEPRLDTLEIDPDRIEELLTPRTRALLLVHLYGRCAYTEKIGDLCRRHQLLLIEDNAQAQGARLVERGEWRVERDLPLSADDGENEYSLSTLHSPLSSKRTGSLGHAAGHSFYPGKNLGAMGDCGAVTTDDDQLAATIRSLGNYGSSKKYVFDYVGRNSRMDEIQAALLQVKLRYIDEDNARRQQIGRRYEQEISNPLIRLPKPMADGENVYHLFPVFTKKRDRLQQYLADEGVETLIHYPIPPHKQACYREWNAQSLPITEQLSREELSLPMSPVLTDEEVGEVIRKVNRFKVTFQSNKVTK
ncbi:MAG: DegT/DnrJ/EryC1/StrS family aminotransferase [Prevotella sp.]|nr:DegT/DnrJ/EryC1/StrS family aminotransferase [Prevotella sp.]